MSTSRPEALPPSLPDLPASVSSAAHLAEFGKPCLVRTVRQPDLPLLADVLASSFHSQNGWMGWLYPVLKTGIYEDLKSRLHHRTHHYACLVAVKPGLRKPFELTGADAASNLLASRDTVMGTVELSLKTPPLLQPWKDKYIYISNLAVKTEYRHQGVAQELLRTCERIALSWGFSDLYLHVLENNGAARRLYWRAGYRLQRVEVNPFSLLLGQPRQLLLHKQVSAQPAQAMNR